MQKLNRIARAAWETVQPYLSWFIATTAFAATIYAVILHAPASADNSALSSNIALVAQVLSVLVGFAFVGATLYLSSYGASDKVYDLLSNIGDYGNILRRDYIDRTAKHRKITNRKFLRFLFTRSGVAKLIFNDPTIEGYSKFFVYRPYWDGVWYQVYNSPYATENRSAQQLAVIQITHEAVVCAAKLLGIVYELREKQLNQVALGNGTLGSKSFIERFDALTSVFLSLRTGAPPDQVRLADAIKFVNEAIYSEHYMFEELNDYTEEVSWDPYELTYFEVIISEYFIWYTFLLVRVQTLRFALAEARSPGLVSRLSEKTKDKYSYAELAKVKEAAFKLRKESISAFGSNKRYRDVRRAAVPAVGVGVFALLGIVLFWPINLAISDQQTIRLLYGTLLGLGIVGIIKSGEFVVLMLMSRTRKVNRSPMGDQG